MSSAKPPPFWRLPSFWARPGCWEEGASPQEREAQTAQMVGCVEELAGLALDYGVSLVMEEYDNELSPIATMEGVRRFLDGCPTLSCAFDTGNFRFANQAVGDAYQLLRDRIGHVHLKDRSYTQRNGEGAKTALDGVNLYPAPMGGGDLPLEDILAQPELELLAVSDEAGVFAVKSEDNRRFFITGHPEYDPETLANEYFRDLSKGEDQNIPAHYFPNDDPSQTPVVRWRSAAQLFYTNWLNYYVYQTTPYDIRNI